MRNGLVGHWSLESNSVGECQDVHTSAIEVVSYTIRNNTIIAVFTDSGSRSYQIAAPTITITSLLAKRIIPPKVMELAIKNTPTPAILHLKTTHNSGFACVAVLSTPYWPFSHSPSQ